MAAKDEDRRDVERLTRWLREYGPASVSAANLAMLMQCSTRRLRRIVSLGRQLGYPIASGDDGYCVGTADDIDRTRRRIEAHMVQEAMLLRTLDDISRRMKAGGVLFP